MKDDTRERIIRRYPIRDFIESQGWQIRRDGKMLCPFHPDKNPSCHVYAEGYNCFSAGCGANGSVIDLMAHVKGIDQKEMFKELAETVKDEPRRPVPHEPKQWRVADTYDYTDEHGQNRFYVDRLEVPGDKKFSQYVVKDGKRINSIKGVERCLYRMHLIAPAEEVFLVEGEKCVKFMASLGYEATTNPGGGSAWLAAYAESLAGKSVIIMPDNDKAGEKWQRDVVASLAGRVKSTAIFRTPRPYNDIADMTTEDAKRLIIALYATVPRVARGIDMPIFSSAELVHKYRQHIKTVRESGACLDLGEWLPKLKFNHYGQSGVRPLIGGDLVTILGSTGTGKTAVLQNIAIAAYPHPVLMFEIELSPELMAERFLALTRRTDAWRIERDIEASTDMDGSGFENVYTCTQSKLDVEGLESLINQSELKIGRRPLVVMVDYIGLLAGWGPKYERVSRIAEEMKVLAKSTSTVLVMASQVARSENPGDPITLHSGKDSGSIENSSQLVLGIWRPDLTTLAVQVLKDTRGQSGDPIMCAYTGAQSLITERATAGDQQ